MKTNTTGRRVFAEGLKPSAKALQPSAKDLPRAALGEEPSGKKNVGEGVFAEGLLSGTRQSICRGLTAALGKVK